MSYSTIWSKDFKDEFFRNGIREWLRKQRITHDPATSAPSTLPLPSVRRRGNLGQALARDLKKRKAILGVFDEGCMGMYNAIIEDHLLNRSGIYKERLSQSALVAAMREIPDSRSPGGPRLDGQEGRHIRYRPKS